MDNCLLSINAQVDFTVLLLIYCTSSDEKWRFVAFLIHIAHPKVNVTMDVLATYSSHDTLLLGYGDIQ